MAATPVPYGYTSDHPLIGEDHWHAPYIVHIGDMERPIFPAFVAGMDTPGDGIIHIHPMEPGEEGANATLALFFSNAGGELTDTSIRLPGSDTIYENGDPVPGDGRPGWLYIAANREAIMCGEPTASVESGLVPAAYVPQDGDVINIWFAPEETGPQPTCIPVQISD